MNKRTASLIIAIICTGIIIKGHRFSESTSNSHFYYYQGKPCYLMQDNSAVFLKLKTQMSAVEVKAILGKYSDALSFDDFRASAIGQLVRLNYPMSESEIESMVNDINSYETSLYTAPAFKPPEEAGNPQMIISPEDEVIIQFKNFISEDAMNSIVYSYNLTQISEMDLTGGKTFVFSINSKSNTIDVANKIFETGLVNYSEPNFYGVNALHSIPNDNNFFWQWSLRNTGNNIPLIFNGTPGCDIRADSAWNISRGSRNIKVAIIDTGVDTLHEDLIYNIEHNSQYDFVEDDNTAFDECGHGTVCAGIVAAEGNNVIGISGVAPECKIFPVRVFDDGSGGTTTSAMLAGALIYSYKIGASVANNSWGWAFSSLIDNAIYDGVTLGRNGKGTVYCFSAGNQDYNFISYPSSNPNVISVGGTSNCCERKSPVSCDGVPKFTGYLGSQYGTGLEVVAPSVVIFATDITGGPGSFGCGPNGYTDSSYIDIMVGTSFAAPLAAGTCALMFSVDSTLRWDSVRTILSGTASKTGNYQYDSPGPDPVLGNTWNQEMGYGMVNAYEALKYVSKAKDLNLTIAIEGFYDSQSHLSTTDTLRVCLRSSSAPFAIADSAKIVFDSLGKGHCLFLNSSNDFQYYIQITHRNSIETWSSAPVMFSDNNLTFNFTTSVTQAYGNNLTLVDSSPVRYALYGGDVNQDGIVDATDAGLVDNDAFNFVSGYISTDVNGDGFVDVDDLVLTLKNSLVFVQKISPEK